MAFALDGEGAFHACGSEFAFGASASRRIAGGRYLRPIVVGLSKAPFLNRLFERMSNAALERENPELASASRKLQRFGTPTTPEAAQR